jgi:predicted HAD superfamily Cof-like phosphohydrolase
MSNMSNFNKVKMFMNTYGQEIRDKASFPNKKIVQLRIDLIQEELNELKDAIIDNDIIEVADALTDILYVTYGAGHSFGINLDKCFDEVQDSNMSKLDENKQPIYSENGKVMKGPNYYPPNLKKIIELD